MTQVPTAGNRKAPGIRLIPTRLRPPSTVTVYYETEGRIEQHSGSPQADGWVFPPPEGRLRPRAWMMLAALDRHGERLRVSRRMDVASVLRQPTVTETDARFRRVARPIFAARRIERDHPRAASAVYVASGLVLIVPVVYFAARAYTLGDPLRLALSMILLSFSLALWYEAAVVAQSRRRDPTVAVIAGLAFLQHPVWSKVGMALLMTVSGALMIHFTRLISVNWWVLALGVVVYLGAAVGATAAATALRFRLLQ